jgi:hypothetical protein
MKFILLLISLSTPYLAFCQMSIKWQKCLGGTTSDFLKQLKQTSDGGILVCGTSYSTNGDIVDPFGAGDYWVVKLDNTGQIQWSRSYGGSWTDSSTDMQLTSDGGMIIVGNTRSSDGQITGHHGNSDIWVIKLDSVGNLEWQRALGGSNEETAESITTTLDGGYVVAGRTVSNDGDAQSPGYLLFDIWLVKLNATGNLVWEKRYGGNSSETATCIRENNEGDLFLAGSTHSNDIDVSGNNGNLDYWVVKLDSEGSIIWQKPLGGPGAESARDVWPTADGGCVVIGECGSNIGQVIGNHGLFDMWVVKLSHVGAIEWQRSLGGSESDYGDNLIQTSDGNFVVSGTVRSTDGDVIDNDGYEDIWVVGLDTTGNIRWQKTLGGLGSDGGNALIQTSDGGLVVGGTTRSNDGDVSGNHGQEDFWVVKLSAESSANKGAGTQPLGIQPNPAGDRVRISAGWEEAMLQVVICDALGRVALHRSIQNNDYIDLSTLPNGLYFLQAVGNSGAHYAGKVLKQRE